MCRPLTDTRVVVWLHLLDWCVHKIGIIYFSIPRGDTGVYVCVRALERDRQYVLSSYPRDHRDLLLVTCVCALFRPCSLSSW